MNNTILRTFKFLQCAALLLLFGTTVRAQSPYDMDFVPKGSICAGVSYNYSAWDHYWQGTSLIFNGNFGTVSTQSIGAGLNFGISNRINAIVALPYVITNPSQGTFRGQHGLQDLRLDVKAKYLDMELGSGRLYVGGDLGFETPVSNYLVDYAPLNIGWATTNFSYRQFVEYQFNKGFYVDLKGNYTYRSNIADIHRGAFYYDQGAAYFTNEVEVPNLYGGGLSLGYKNSTILGEVSYQFYKCTGGSDIRIWDPPFPTNEMNGQVISARFDYHLPKPTGLYFELMGGYTLAGRNIGKSTYGGITLNYTFHAWGSK